MMSVTAWSRKPGLNLLSQARLRGILVRRFWEQTKFFPFYRSFGSFEKDKSGVLAEVTASHSIQFVRVIGHASNTQGKNSNREKFSLSATAGVISLAAVGALLLFLYGLGPTNHDVETVEEHHDIPQSIQEASTQHVTQKLEDVKGVDEVITEMKQVVDFLRDPKKYAGFGAKLPKVVLLVGEPGTGKKLLGRAVAGEARVPYFYLNGSELAEMEIGLALRRVKRVYELAKVQAPCVLMIDKIHAIGYKRASSKKRPFENHVMNQLLAEIERIGENVGVVTIASTSPGGKDCLDKEFLRAGGLSIVVEVPVPDLKGRKEILEKYLRQVKCGCDMALEEIARQTLGFTGAELEEIVYQTMLKARDGDDNCNRLAKVHLDYGRERVMQDSHYRNINLGILSEKEKSVVAHHEAGHALMALLTDNLAQLDKVTIIPKRGGSHGHTSIVPQTTGIITRNQKLALMQIQLGGMAAEALLLGGDDKMTSGGQSDLQEVIVLGRDVVTISKRSRALGLHSFTEYSNVVKQIGDSDVGGKEKGMIDNEVKKLVNERYYKTKLILRQHSKQLKALADALLKYETLDAERVKQIIAESGYKSRDL